MPFDVFISYSHRDKLVADAACAAMEAEGIRCWIAPRDIRPGADWSEAIAEGVDQCRIVALIFSSNANESRQVRREVARAFNEGLTIVPVRIEPVEPHKALAFQIESFHWLDALTEPREQYLRELARHVKAILATKPGPPPPAAAATDPVGMPRPSPAGNSLDLRSDMPPSSPELIAGSVRLSGGAVEVGERPLAGEPAPAPSGARAESAARATDAPVSCAASFDTDASVADAPMARPPAADVPPAERPAGAATLAAAGEARPGPRRSRKRSILTRLSLAAGVLVCGFVAFAMATVYQTFFYRVFTRGFPSHTLSLPALVPSMAFSLDGQRLLSGATPYSRSGSFTTTTSEGAGSEGDSTARVWDAANGTAVFSLVGHSNGVQSVAFSPDGKLIATAGSDIRLWGAADGHLVNVLQDKANGFAFAQRSPQLFSSNGNVWDIVSGKFIRTLTQPCIVSDSHGRSGVNALSPDESLILGSGDGEPIRICDTRTSQVTASLQSSPAISWTPVQAVFLPDGKRLLAIQSDSSARGGVQIWDIPSGQQIKTFGDSRIDHFAASASGNRVVTAWFEHVEVWDAQPFPSDPQQLNHALTSVEPPYKNITYELLKSFRSSGDFTESVAISPDGRRIAAAGHSLTGSPYIDIWDLSTPSP